MEVAPSRVDQGPDVMIQRHLDLAGLPSPLPACPVADPRRRDRLWWSTRSVPGLIQSPPGLPGWDDVPLVATVEAALKRPTVVDNDATACAIAEWWFGAGRERGVSHLVYLTISTGVGGGLILDGRVYRGAAGNAGELGHLTVDYLGRQCGCGRRGCLEAYASGPQIAARARERMAAGRELSLAALPR